MTRGKEKLYIIGSQSRTLKQWREILGDLPLREVIRDRVNRGWSFMEAISRPSKREKHGLRNHPLYKIWVGINRRCNNPNFKYYKNYGAKGITVCPEWHIDNPNGCRNFIDDMYLSYKEGYQLDKDIKAAPGQPKCYSKDTCCWVRCVKNNRHRASTKLTEKDVKEIKRRLNLNHSQTDIAKDYGVSQGHIANIKLGNTWKDITI